jgi:flagellin FlaB
VKKGESGVGTLIIFIAMLLVAAIAAGVLIQTTGSLQNKALITGTQSRAQISTHIEALSLTGTNGSDSDLENISIIAKLSAGSDAIDLSEVVMVAETSQSSDSYRMSNGTTVGFKVSYLQNGTEHKPGYLKFGDVAQLDFDLFNKFNEGQNVRVDIIPKIGISTTLEMVMPDIVSQYRVHLYP